LTIDKQNLPRQLAAIKPMTRYHSMIPLVPVADKPLSRAQLPEKSQSNDSANPWIFSINQTPR
jgi:hypothetical protein